MHFAQIAISSLLVGASIAKPLGNVARQEADLPSIPELGALPAPTELFPALSRRQDDAFRETGNRQGGPPEGSGNGGGRGNDKNVVIGPDGNPVEEGNQEEQVPPPSPAAAPPPTPEQVTPPPPLPEAVSPPPPPPSPAAPSPEVAKPPSPMPEQPKAQPPPPVAAGGKWGDMAVMGVLPEEIRNKMMPMIWELGPVTQLKPGLGTMGQVLPKINNVDSKASS